MIISLTQKQAAAAFVVLVSLATTCILSFGILWTHHKIDREFFALWPPDLIHGWMIAVPTGFLLNPHIKKLIDRYTETTNVNESVEGEFSR